jgi:iron(III) transport system permease protein
VALALLFLQLYRRFTINAARYRTISGKGYRPRQLDLGGWRFVALGGVVVYLSLAALLPFLILGWGSLLPFYQPPARDLIPKLSLDGYTRILNNATALEAFRNTLLVVVVVTIAVLAITSVSAWLIVRSRVRGKSVLDVMTFLPHTMPSIVIGLAIALVYLFLPIPIYGTVWIIVVGIATKQLAFPSRALISAQVQIHGELEEAAQVSGAGVSTRFLRVVIPLMLPAIINVGIWIVMQSMRELSIALMLYSQHTAVISTLIWNEWTNGRVQDAGAMGVLLTLLVAGLAFGSRAALVRPVQR